MAQRPTQPANENDEPIEDRLDTQTIALRIVAGLLILGAAHILTVLLVPLVLALFVSIALTPVANWLERRAGLPRAVTSLAGLLFVALTIAAISGVVVYQAGSIIQNSEKYLNGFGGLLADMSQKTGGHKFMESLGVFDSAEAPPGGSGSEASSARSGAPPAQASPAGSQGATGPSTGGAPAGNSQQFYTDFLRSNLRTIGSWLVTGLGGLLGFLGGIVIFLAYVFYMLNTRDDWIRRLRSAAGQLGMSARSEYLERVRDQMVTYIGYLFLVSLCYAVAMTLILWLIGVPQPLLWGVLTGLLEVIPYFGPFIAAALPTIVSLSLGTWWQPLAIVAVFALLQTIEGYVVAPMIYGSAVHLNPVTVIFGILFFGLVWGPIGLMTAMPMMILLRGLLTMSPDTPALDALADVDGQKAAARVAKSKG